MLISTILVLAVFFGVVILILLDKYNRAVVALTGAVVCFFILTYLEGTEPSVIIDYLIGSETEDFVNLQSLILIFGMSIIVNVSHSAGVFRYLAFRFVQMVAKNPKRLLPMLCFISVLLSAILNNILTVMILIPLTITISRMLNFDPEPYILTQAILVNIGGTIFSISSIPNILVVPSAGLSFNQFFINIGLFSLLVFVITVGLFYVEFKNDLSFDEKNIKILMEFDPMNFIQSKTLFKKSVYVLITVLVCFIIVPSSIIPANIIALTGAILLIILSGLDQNKIIEKIDTELFLYLMGIFIIAGAVENVGIITIVGKWLLGITSGNVYTAVILILWTSAILSATIDNIPITKILIPVVNVIVIDFSPEMANFVFFSLIFGVNWGDNLTPMGDNILVMNLAKKNKRPIDSKKFFRLGFTTTVIQLLLATFYLSLNFSVIGSILSIFILGFIIFIKLYHNSERYFGKKWDLGKTLQKLKEVGKKPIENRKSMNKTQQKPNSDEPPKKKSKSEKKHTKPTKEN